MTNVDVIGNELREKITSFLVPLQTGKGINEDAFDGVNNAARQLASSLKGSEMLPRSLLNELYVVINVIRAERPHLKTDARMAAEMAAQLEMTFGLILRGESHDDRKPGVPRIL